MTARTWRLALVVSALASLLACPHAGAPPATSGKPAALPTLDRYSEGTARLATDFGAAFRGKDAKALSGFIAPDVTFVPAETPTAPPFLSPAGIRVERFGASAPRKGAEEALRELTARREGFAGVVRNDVSIAGISGRGPKRTVRVHAFFAGIALDGSRRQDESWWRWELTESPAAAAPKEAAPVADTAAAPPATDSAADKATPGAATESAAPGGAGPLRWRIDAMTEEARTIVSAGAPLLHELYPTGEAEDWISDSDVDAEFANTATPGHHDTGGVAVIDDCVNSGPCLLFASGMGLGALSRGSASQEGPFKNQAELIGLGMPHGEAKGIVSADFDNDGIPDLFVSYDGKACLFYRGRRFLDPGRDEGPPTEHLKFDEITANAGVGDMIGPYRGVVAIDADRDGRLDLYVVQHGDSSKTGPSARGDNGQPNRFFHNVTEPGGPIKFVEETESSGAGNRGWGLSATAADYDGDGWPDLFVTNAYGPSALLHNATTKGGPVRFIDVTEKAHLGEAGSWVGASWGDYDGDGDFDLLVTQYASDLRWIIERPEFPASSSVRTVLAGRAGGNALYRNDGGGRFTKAPATSGLSDAGWPWGVAWSDIDGDGRLDAIVGNGMIFGTTGINREIDYWNQLGARWAGFVSGKETIDFGADGITGPQPERLFLNLGDGTFTDVAYAAGLVTMADVRGLVASDINADGAPDIVGSVFLGSPIVFENMNVSAPGRVIVVLMGSSSNTEGVGAIVHFTAGGKTQVKQHEAGGSFLSSAGRALDFSLAGASSVDRIEVFWPSGKSTRLEAPQPSRGKILVTEPAATPATEPH